MVSSMTQTQDRSAFLIIGLGIIVTIALIMNKTPNLAAAKTRFGIFYDQLRPAPAVKIQNKIHIHELDIENKSIDELYTEKKEQNRQAVTSQQINRQKSLAQNELGVTLVLKEKYWDGLYHFSQAIELDPSHIAPIINMAVTLEEMGMTRPATRYVAMAGSLEPDHPWLQKNFPTESEHFLAQESEQVLSIGAASSSSDEIIMQ